MTIRCDDDKPIQFPLTKSEKTVKTKKAGVEYQVKTRVEGVVVTRSLKHKDLVIRRKFEFTNEGVSVRYSINMKSFRESMSIIIDYDRQAQDDLD